MSVTYKLKGGVYKISPEASLFLANQMWLAKEQYGVSPGTIEIDSSKMVYKRMGMTLGILHFQMTNLFVSNGVLHYIGNIEAPLCNQAQIWAFELSNA